MFQTILVPVDLTPKNAGAIEVAGELAANRKGAVTLLHVIETLDLPWEEVEDFYHRLERRARAEMEDMCEPLRREEVEHRSEIVFGRRAEEVVAYAEDREVDLIVLSSHRVDLENPAAGWTTLSYKVAILAQCPVLLVK
jgi:universal stress protein A